MCVFTKVKLGLVPCRFRVCQLVAKMMNYAADAQTKIGPDRLDRVQEVMMQRLYDKVSQCILLLCVKPLVLAE